MFLLEEELERELEQTTPKNRYINNRNAIAILKELSPNQTATSEQKVELAKYNGWGSLATVFSLNPQGWTASAQVELKQLLTTEEYHRAADSILNAYYTDPKLVRAIWHLISKMGFNGGRILEPGCGTGLFYSCMPENIRENSELHGVELEPISGRIAQLLHDDARVMVRGFEQVQLPDNYFDLVISNVPFGDYKINDSRYQHLGLSIHNYFLAKSADLVRPGGLVAIITSTYTMDAPGSLEFRRWLGEKLRLEVAVRIPAGSHDFASTKVTTDLLIFRKLSTGSNKVEPNILDWEYTPDIFINHADWGISESAAGSAKLNKWFIKEFNGRKTDVSNLKFALRYKGTTTGDYYLNDVYPETHKLLGQPSINELYGSGFALTADERDVLTEIKAFPVSAIYTPDSSNKAATSENLLVPNELIDAKEGSFCEYMGAIFIRRSAYIVKAEVEIERVRDFWELREKLQTLIKAQVSASDDQLGTCQIELRSHYDKFIRKWGKLNAKQNLIKLGSDPNYYIVRTLEVGVNKLADIFSKRVCRTDSDAVSVQTAQDAMVHCLQNKGCLDFEYMAEILGRDTQSVIDELAESNTIYYDPAQSIWVRADKYLSGNVYLKLKEAKHAKLTKNVQALEAVQPLTMLPKASEEFKIACLFALGVEWETLDENQKKKLLNKTINARIGQSWIGCDVFEQFAKEVLGISVKCKYFSSAGGSWVVAGSSKDKEKYGTSNLDSKELLTKALNNVDPYIIIRDSQGDVNREQTAIVTEAARAKYKLIRQAFKDWVWTSRERTIKLCLIYNSTINVFAAQETDTSWLTLPGSNPEINLNWWQKRGAVKIVENEANFLAHFVGAGKTFTMAASIMECRRLGFASKPILVVLNGTEKQTEEEFRKLYPMANLLVPKKLDAEGRKLFTAALATADFDCAIITHSQYFTLAVPHEQKLAFLNKEKEIIEDLLIEVKEDRGSAKQIRKVLKGIEARIQKVNDSKRKDNHIDFSGLCDLLILDEIHKFKNLFVFTKMNNIRGIPSNYSQRATDTYLKILQCLGQLFEETKGKVVGATGTLMSNTLAEVYNWMRMFQGKVLKELGIESFDAWASEFAEPIASAEISPSGKYKVITRLKQFSNLQVLRGIMSQFLDIVTPEMVGDSLKRPKANFIDVTCPPSDDQLEFLSQALERSERIAGGRVDPTEDNMLKVTTDLTKAALSMRLLGKRQEATESKIHECTWNVFKIWEQTSVVKGVQAIFCDYSVPRKDRYSVYNYVKILLVKLGIPGEQIEFIHDHDQAKRKVLFERINSGKVRVVLGSTEKLGTGCNIHEGGLWAMHHLDAPWRPSDIEQREGRGARQGNGKRLSKALSKCWIFRYVTERLDALRWQTLQWKQEMISKFMNGYDIDEMEDNGEVSYSFAQVKSLATGNPMLIEESNLRNELNSLLLLQRSYEQDQFSLQMEINHYKRSISDVSNTIDALKVEIPLIGDAPTDKKARKSINSKISNALAHLLVNKIDDYQAIIKYRGCTLYASASFKEGQIDAFIATPSDTNQTRTYFPLTGNNGELIKLSRVSPLQCVDDLIDTLVDPLYTAGLNNRLESYKVSLTNSEAKITSEFEDSDKIAQLNERLRDISAIMAEHEAIITADKAEKVLVLDLEEDEETGTYLGEDLSIAETVCSDDIVEILKSREEIPDWLKDIQAVISEFYVSPSALVESESAAQVVEITSVDEQVESVFNWEPIPLAIWGKASDKPIKKKGELLKSSSSATSTQLSLFDVA
jgi:N12 class adenine-specific DNA methylase/SAM-dependent methyltransferase